MSKRKGRRLTSEIKSVLRAPPDGELEPSQQSLDEAVEAAASGEVEVSGEAAESDSEASLDGAPPASEESARNQPSSDRDEPAGPASDPLAEARDAVASSGSVNGVEDVDSVRSDEPVAPRRKTRRSRAGMHVETETRAGAKRDFSAPDAAAPDIAAPDVAAPDLEPLPEATAEDFAAAARAARDAQTDDDDGEDSVARERFAEPISFDDTGDDTEGFLRGLVEALLFTSQKPIDIKDLARSAGIDKPRARELIEQLRRSYEGRGLCIEEIAGGFVMRSSPRYAPYIHKILALKPVRLSRAQLETLAIVAYRQPVTKPEVDDIRGVDSGQVIKGLLERGLLKMLGKKDEPGHPTLYGTTNEFLELLNLQSLKDLPTLREYTELSEESQRKFMEATGETPPSDTMTFERPSAGESDGEEGRATVGERDVDGRNEQAGVDFADESARDVDPSDEPGPHDGTGRSQSDVVPIDDADLGDPEDVSDDAAASGDDDDADDDDADDDDADDDDDDDDDADDDEAVTEGDAPDLENEVGREEAAIEDAEDDAPVADLDEEDR